MSMLLELSPSKKWKYGKRFEDEKPLL